MAIIAYHTVNGITCMQKHVELVENKTFSTKYVKNAPNHPIGGCLIIY